VPLTRRQKQILDFLQSYMRTNGLAPSFEEIAEHFDFASLATVHEHLTNLEPSRKPWPFPTGYSPSAARLTPSECAGSP
jgi:repressor LexA